MRIQKEGLKANKENVEIKLRRMQYTKNSLRKIKMMSDGDQNEIMFYI